MIPARALGFVLPALVGGPLVAVPGSRPQAKGLTPVLDRLPEAGLGDGRAPGELATLRRELRARPGQALPLARYSRALLDLGLGGPAREAARKAVAADPQCGPAQEALARALQADEAGRRYRTGWDRAGAAEAFARALAADPGLVGARQEYARLLERDAAGLRFGPGADLAGAVEQYRRLRAKGNRATDLELLGALAGAGQFKEACDLAPSLPETPARNVLWAVSLVRLKGGAPAAAELAAKLGSAFTWKGCMEGTVLHFMNRREPGVVAPFLKASGLRVQGGESPFLIAGPFLMGGPAEERPLDRQDPRSVLVRILALHAGGTRDPEAYAPHLSPGLRALLRRPDVWQDFLGCLGAMRMQLEETGLEPRPALDLALSIGNAQMDGDPDLGWRVATTIPGRDRWVLRQSWGFSRVEGTCRLATLPLRPEACALEALDRLGAGDLRGARAFLDRALDLVKPEQGAAAADNHPFLAFWTEGKEGDAGAIRTAAAVLGYRLRDDPRVLPALEQARAAAAEPAVQARLDLALAMALGTREAWAGAEAALARMEKVLPPGATSRWARTTWLRKQGRWAELYEVEGRELARDPRDGDILDSRLGTLGALGRYEERLRFLQARIQTGWAGPVDFNNLAWYQLLAGQVGEGTVAAARRAATSEGPVRTNGLMTLAAVLAEAGPPEEAAKALQAGLEGPPPQEPGPDAWYVLGRIAERIGETETARALYARVTPDPPPAPEGDSSHSLAQRRLKNLGPESLALAASGGK